jgi:hypothetical protein
LLKVRFEVSSVNAVRGHLALLLFVRIHNDDRSSLK